MRRAAFEHEAAVAIAAVDKALLVDLQPDARMAQGPADAVAGDAVGADHHGFRGGTGADVDDRGLHGGGSGGLGLARHVRETLENQTRPWRGGDAGIPMRPIAPSSIEGAPLRFPIPLQSGASGRSMDLPAYAIEAEGLFKTYPATKTAPEKMT